MSVSIHDIVAGSHHWFTVSRIKRTVSDDSLTDAQKLEAIRQELSNWDPNR